MTKQEILLNYAMDNLKEAMRYIKMAREEMNKPLTKEEETSETHDRR